MGEWIKTTRSVGETKEFAGTLARRLSPGSVVALEGDLGMGKTHFVQGLARALGVSESTEVVSPTYSLVNEYEGATHPVIHMDFYRLLDEDSAIAMGIEDQIHRSSGVVAIEWADHLRSLVPRDAVWIRFEWVSETERRLHIKGTEPF